jgi:membrane associated rhomboid family serine protease
MKITYNAPFVLTFSLVCLAIQSVSHVFGSGFTNGLFAVGPSMNVLNPLDYLRLFSHAMGHQDWNHFFGNMTYILLLGPILEEKYGTIDLAFMCFATALITGILNVLFMSTGLLGASGLVFMMIVLSSVTNAQKGVIPLTFIFVVIMYIGKEVLDALTVVSNVSHFGHIVGGIAGGAFAFFKNNMTPSK